MKTLIVKSLITGMWPLHIPWLIVEHQDKKDLISFLDKKYSIKEGCYHLSNTNKVDCFYSLIEEENINWWMHKMIPVERFSTDEYSK